MCHGCDLALILFCFVSLSYFCFSSSLRNTVWLRTVNVRILRNEMNEKSCGFT